jgi:hypothetical protein
MVLQRVFTIAPKMWFALNILPVHFSLLEPLEFQVIFFFLISIDWLDPLLSETGNKVFFRSNKVWTLVQHGSGRSSKQDHKRFLKLHKWASVAHEVLQFLIVLSLFIATWSACQVCDFYLLKILHFRAMDFLVELFRNLLEHADWTMTQACTDSYTKTLKKFHGWLASSSFTVESFTLYNDPYKWLNSIHIGNLFLQHSFLRKYYQHITSGNVSLVFTWIANRNNMASTHDRSKDSFELF